MGLGGTELAESKFKAYVLSLKNSGINVVEKDGHYKVK